MMRDLRQALRDPEPIVCDGGMATSLYNKGFYINRSFEELNLTNEESVREVMLGFKNAGAKILHTNTFGATIPKMTEYGLQGQLSDILREGTRIGLEVADGDCWVLGAMGPLGVVLEPLGPTGRKEAFAFFRDVAAALDQSGVHGFSLGTFQDLTELKVAIQAIRDVSDKPILAHISIQESMRTTYGHTLNELAQLGESEQLDGIGINGQVGPSGVFSACEILRNLTSLPLSMRPDAGLPRYINDEYIYLCNPDYMAKYAKRLVQAGALIVGGSSGVYVEHIRAIANSVRMLKPRVSISLGKQVDSIGVKDGERAIERIPLELCSKWGRRLKDGHTMVSVELNPPKGVDCSRFFEKCQELEEGNVEFVNIPDGARAMAKMSSMQLASYICNHFDIEPIPHYTCRDRNLLGLQADLLGGSVNGVRNVLLVTGDPPKLGNCPNATAVYDVDAIGLTHVVSRMNQGLDLGGSAFGQPTEFVTGVALNPTSHNIELEASRFKYKIEAGADYAMTQPIYDIEAYKSFFDFLHEQKKKSLIPVVVGIWPLVSLRNAEFLKHEVPGVEVPENIIERLEKAGNNKDDALKIGIDISLEIADKIKSLHKDYQVAGFQIAAPFNRVDVALEVVRSI